MSSQLKLADKISICTSLPLTSTPSCDERRLLWFAIFKTRNGEQGMKQQSDRGIKARGTFRIVFS